MALASRAPFAEGGQERTSGRCCGHNHDTARAAANGALTAGKVDIALLAREISWDLMQSSLCPPGQLSAAVRP